MMTKSDIEFLSSFFIRILIYIRFTNNYFLV